MIATIVLSTLDRVWRDTESVLDGAR